jgi:hypothetical protein
VKWIMKNLCLSKSVRGLIAVGMVAVMAGVLSGCSPDAPPASDTAKATSDASVKTTKPGSKNKGVAKTPGGPDKGNGMPEIPRK